MQFLHDAQKNVHARVRLVASGLLATLDEDIRNGVDVCAIDHPVNRRMEAFETLSNQAAGRFFAFSAQAVSNLRSAPPINHPTAAQTQESMTAENASMTANDRIAVADGVPLIYPKRLDENQRELANRYLATTLPEQRQPILDELEGRFRSEEKGMAPLYDEMRFLNSLCKAMRNGCFKLNLGARVRAERAVREKARERRRQGSGPPPEFDLPKLKDQIEAGIGAFSKIRKSLGRPGRIDKDLPDEPK